MIVKDLEKFIEGFLYWSFLHKFMTLERKTVKQKVTKGKNISILSFKIGLLHT